MKELLVVSPSGTRVLVILQAAGEPAEVVDGLENWKTAASYWCRSGITTADRGYADIKIVAGDHEDFLPRIIDYLRGYDPTLTLILRELHS